MSVVVEQFDAVLSLQRDDDFVELCANAHGDEQHAILWRGELAMAHWDSRDGIVDWFDEDAE